LIKIIPKYIYITNGILFFQILLIKTIPKLKGPLQPLASAGAGGKGVGGYGGYSTGTIQPPHIRASILSAIEDKIKKRLREKIG
jgi:hypothetical protein